MAILDSSAAAGQIPLKPRLPLHSIARLARPGAAFDRENHVRLKHHKIPRPDIFKKNKSRELRKLRNAQIWKTGTLDQQVEQMAQWFPSLPPGGSTKGLSNPCLEQLGDIWSRPDSGSDGGGGGSNGSGGFSVLNFADYRGRAAKYSSDSARSVPTEPSAGPCPISDMGAFAKLPGEVRNNIYRFAVLEEDKSASALIKLQPNTCAVGPCLHNKARHCMPAIISTCKQIRHECAPIFFNENAGIAFDDGMVLQGCISNWVRTVGPYLDQVRKLTFKFLRPIHHNDIFFQWATYSISFSVAKYSESGEFELSQSVVNTLAFNPPRDEICMCDFVYECRDMNDQWHRHKYPKTSGVRVRPGKETLSKHLITMVQSERFLDFVFRVRRNKQPHSLLKKCKRCKEVNFRA